MPSKTIMVLTCIGCGGEERAEQSGFYGAPAGFAGWICVTMPDAAPAPPEYLCPSCSENLPAPALEHLRRLHDAGPFARALPPPTFVYQAPAVPARREPARVELATTAAGERAELPPLALFDGGAATVETFLLRLIQNALNENGQDVGRAARNLVEQYEAIPKEKRAQTVEALARALIERLDMVPDTDKTRWLVYALSAASPIVLMHQAHHGANGTIKHQA